MYYDKIANGYDELYGEEQLNKVRIIKEKVIIQGLTLDVGAGTGISSKEFNAIALDPSFNMVKKYNGFKVVGVAENLPFKDKIFDNVISLTALHHTNLEKALAEIKRVCKGNIIISMLKGTKEIDGFKKLDGGKDWIFINQRG